MDFEEDFSDGGAELSEEMDDDYSDDEKEQTIEDLLNMDSDIVKLSNMDVYQNYLDDEKQTFPKLTKYERTLIIGIRSQQIANGAKPLVTLDQKNCDVSYISNKELVEHKLPFIIKRKINDNTVEYWRLSDLEY